MAAQRVKICLGMSAPVYTSAAAQAGSSHSAFRPACLLLLALAAQTRPGIFRIQPVRPVAELRAQRDLMQQGYGLLIFDAYRPWYVTKIFWDATPPDKHEFVADPAEGSRHNRGCAVDLSLYDLKTGHEIEMTGGYDEMSERSYPDYAGGTAVQRAHRQVLRSAMENARVHRLSLRVVALRLPRLEAVPYPECSLRDA